MRTLWVVHIGERVRVGTCACPSEARAGLIVSSCSTFCFIALRQGLLLSLKLTVTCRLADQCPLGIHLCLSPALEWYTDAALIGFLYECWRFKPRTSCLQSKCCYPLSHPTSAPTVLNGCHWVSRAKIVLFLCVICNTVFPGRPCRFVLFEDELLWAGS